MNQRTALITGASAGIGKELAPLFAADGYSLILVARREKNLQELAFQIESQHKTKVQILAEDLSDPRSPHRIFEACQKKGWPVDVLVNNAGFGANGIFHELDEKEQIDMIQVNVTALTHLTRLFLPDLIQRGRGGILNVGSTAGFQPGPTMAVYYATKAFVLSFTEALAEELAPTSLHVSCLCPGPTLTEFGKKSQMEDRLLFKLGAMDAAAVARVGFQGFKKNQLIVIPGLRNKLIPLSVRFSPRFLVRKVVKELQKKS